MKKKILTFILALCLIIPATFMFTACSTTKDDNVQIRVQDGYVQWSSDDSDWKNVITIDEILDAIGDDITGPQGEQGVAGKQGEQGVAGKQVEFNVSSTHIQWRYVGDSAWNNLVKLEDLEGTDGRNGATWLTGTSTPNAELGNDGDLYLNTDSYDIYKKGNGSWSLIGNIEGQDGSDGISYYVHIKYTSETPSYSATLTDTPSKWIGIYSGTAKTAPTSFTKYKWYKLKDDKEVHQVSYNYNLPEVFQSYYIEYSNSSENITEGDCLNLPEFDDYVSRYFIGWYTGSEQDDIKYTNFIPVYRELNLIARWDTVKLEKDMIESAGYSLYFSETNNNLIVCNDELNLPSGYTKCLNGGNTIGRIDNIKIPAFYAAKGKYYPVTHICSLSFDDTTIKTLHIPATIDVVGTAFVRCTSLTSVTISEGVKNISQNAFEGCSSLKSIYIPNSVTISETAFDTNTSLCHDSNTSVSSLTGFIIIGDLSYGEYLIYQKNDMI